MAHFAQIINNAVTNIIVVNNDVLQDTEFPESEPIGVAFCKSLYGEDTEWMQVSYNGNFRGVYPGAGMIYDPKMDQFIQP